MEKIKVNELVFSIQSIVPVSDHVIRIEFASDIPQEYGDIDVYTEGGIQCSHLPGFSTVYKQEEMTVWLSNDGSIYSEPEVTEPYPEPEPYVPTLEEVKQSKKLEISSACEAVIYQGIDVGMSDGTVQHFSLTEKDQLNLFGKQAQLASGSQQFEYHADGCPCTYYSAADMTSIITQAMFWVSYQTTYCNAINMWIAGCETAEDVALISYGADVPEQYQSDVLKAYIIEMMQTAESEIENETAE